MSLSHSISDTDNYTQACYDATVDNDLFNEFRVTQQYNLILEHAIVPQSEVCINVIKEDSEIMSYLDSFRLNDKYGGPLLHDFGGDVGMFCPSTLKYIKVLFDLKKYFGSLDGMSICEIGGGYGGQCRIINAMYKPVKYTMVDLRPSLDLARKYLDKYVLNSVMEYKSLNELVKSDYDLVISNYAFSELSQEVQQVYLDKIVLSSNRGYMIYNHISPGKYKTMHLDKIREIIKNTYTYDEVPLTSPLNKVLVWGENE